MRDYIDNLPRQTRKCDYLFPSTPSMVLLVTASTITADRDSSSTCSNWCRRLIPVRDLPPSRTACRGPLSVVALLQHPSRAARTLQQGQHGPQLNAWELRGRAGLRFPKLGSRVRIVLTSAVRSEAARLLEPWVPAPTSTSTATWVNMPIFGSQKCHRLGPPSDMFCGVRVGICNRSSLRSCAR